MMYNPMSARRPAPAFTKSDQAFEYINESGLLNPVKSTDAAAVPAVSTYVLIPTAESWTAAVCITAFLMLREISLATFLESNSEAAFLEDLCRS